MAQPMIARASEPGDGMGKVFTQIEVRNADDVRRAQRGELADRDVRTVFVDGVLVDTGATTLCLPESLVRQLGLPLEEEVPIQTATSIETVGLYEDARLTVLGRTRQVQCLQLPDGSPPLLGVIPLEILGLELDLQNQRLVPLPDTGPRAYMTA